MTALHIAPETPNLPPVPRGWKRPVRPVALIVVGGVVLLVWLVLMAASVWYFYEHWEARLTLHNQDVSLRLPVGMQALAEVSSPIQTRINMRPLVQVPIKQTMAVQLPDHLQANVTLHTVLPVDTSVSVDVLVPVKTTLSLSVPLHSWLPNIKVALPLTVNLPVHMVVPVKAQVPVDLDMVVSGDLPPVLNVPIETTFDLRPEVKGRIQAHMVNQAAFSLVSPVEPFGVRIEQAHLRVPFNLTFLTQRAR